MPEPSWVKGYRPRRTTWSVDRDLERAWIKKSIEMSPNHTYGEDPEIIEWIREGPNWIQTTGWWVLDPEEVADNGRWRMHPTLKKWVFMIVTATRFGNARGESSAGNMFDSTATIMSMMTILVTLLVALLGLMYLFKIKFKLQICS